MVAVAMCVLLAAGCRGATHSPSPRRAPSGAQIPATTAAAPAGDRYPTIRLATAVLPRFRGVDLHPGGATVKELGPPGAGPLAAVAVDPPQCRELVRGGQVWRFLHSPAVPPDTPVAIATERIGHGRTIGTTLISLTGDAAVSFMTQPALTSPECLAFHVQDSGAWQPASVREHDPRLGLQSRMVVRDYPRGGKRIMYRLLLYRSHGYVALLHLGGPAADGDTPLFEDFARRVYEHAERVLQ
jgi:hypothetical protein